MRALIEIKGLQLADWPTNSPDSNMIEHVRPRLKSEIRRVLESERKGDLLEAIGQLLHSCTSYHDDTERAYLQACSKALLSVIPAIGRGTKCMKNRYKIC